MSGWSNASEVTMKTIDEKIQALYGEYSQLDSEMQQLKQRWDLLAARRTEIEGSVRSLQELKASLESLLAEKSDNPVPLGDKNDPDDEDK